MANVREIKLRIKSVKETRQITKAMKLISAAKRKKARRQLDQALPYFEKVGATLADILARSGEIGGRYFDRRDGKPEKTTGILALTGDKSLTGGYNHNIIRHTEQLCREQENTVLFVAGQIGRSHFQKAKIPLDEAFGFQVSEPTVRRAEEMAQWVLGRFLSGELDTVYLTYTHMIHTFRLEPRTVRLLPLDIAAWKRTGMEAAGRALPGAPICYEPSREAFFDALVPKYLRGVLYGALVEAYTSEQSARMTAMDSATSNAEKMISTLTLQQNRARQAAITQEITEIIGGASALE